MKKVVYYSMSKHIEIVIMGKLINTLFSFLITHQTSCSNGALSISSFTCITVSFDMLFFTTPIKK